MKNFILLLLAVWTCSLSAQDHTVSATPNNEFDPAFLTITAGETVLFQNQGGFHNVNGTQATYPDNPESFGNGGASSASWTYSYTFNTPGTYEYQCDPHVGLNMFGTITVMPAAGPSDLVISEIMYNNPGGDDYEFVEIYNNGDDAVDMNGYQMGGVTYTFGSYTLAAGGYVVVAEDGTALTTDLGLSGVDVFTWTDGALSNGGETVSLLDAAGTVLDEVTYSDGGGWPSAADGGGPSLVLCDFDADNNDPANWQPSTTSTGFSINDLELLASPGAENNCSDGAFIGFATGSATVDENTGTIDIEIVFTNDNNPTTVTIETTGTADSGDFSAANTVTSSGMGGTSTATLTVTINDDTDMEGPESVTFTITGADNDGNINGGQESFTLNIVDNDIMNTNALLITGVYDAQPGGAGAKGVELKALADIPDLGAFGISSANNGGGPTGSPEFMFPTGVSVTAGECIFIANDSMDFADFFGFDADFIDGVANINGDDAIELFENGTVIDVFGDVNVDGSGEVWDYLDGWAYRQAATGPDGDTFDPSNWTYSGVDALDGPATNADADNPFPVCSYNTEPPQVVDAVDDNVTTDINMMVIFDVLANDIAPAVPGTSTVMQVTDPVNGTLTMPNFFSFAYTPNTDFCGEDSFDYSFMYTTDDGAVSIDTATVFITVNCPSQTVDIEAVEENDADGEPVLLGQTVTITGTVYGIDLQGNDNVQFTVIDATGGIGVFSTNSFGYTVNETDLVTITGEVTQFNGLTQLNPDTIILEDTNQTLVDPAVVTELGEDTESELIKIEGLMVVEQNGANWTVTNGTDEFVLRVDNDVEPAVSDLLAQAQANNQTFNATGIGGQFDNSSPYFDGYQFLPRYAADIDLIIGTENVNWSNEIAVFPNPAEASIFIRSTVDFRQLTVVNAMGQQVGTFNAGTTEIDVTELPTGLYFLTFRTDSQAWTTRVRVN